MDKRFKEGQITQGPVQTQNMNQVAPQSPFKKNTQSLPSQPQVVPVNAGGNVSLLKPNISRDEAYKAYKIAGSMNNDPEFIQHTVASALAKAGYKQGAQYTPQQIDAFGRIAAQSIYNLLSDGNLINLVNPQMYGQ